MLIQNLLEYNDIEVVLRFPPINLGGIMRLKGHGVGECPVLEDVWFNRQMSLPISPQMSDEQVEYVCTVLGSMFRINWRMM